MIRHHLDPEQIVAYASGASSPADALLVASHLTLCPTCRADLERAEAVGGTLLQQVDPANDDLEALLDATLAHLDDPTPEPPARRHDPAGVLPAPLAELVGPFDALPWKRVFPGVRQVIVDVPTDGMPVRLFELRPGMAVPAHSHRGREDTLVLTGGFSDDGGHFQRGDVCLRGEGAVHRQHIDEGPTCVVLTLADHPLIAHTLRGWIGGRLRSL